MKHWSRPTLSLLTVMWCLVGLVPCAAEVIVVATVELPVAPVQARLDDAVVTVRVDPTGSPVLRELADAVESEPAVQVVRESGVVVVVRREGTLRQVDLELVLPTLAGVEITGNGLDLQVVELAFETPETEDSDAGSAVVDPSTISDPNEQKAAWERLRLEQAAELRAEEAKVFGDPLRPPSLAKEEREPGLTLDLGTSTVMIQGASVPVLVRAEDSSLVLERCSGGVSWELQSALAQARKTAGACAIELVDSELALDQLAGDLSGSVDGGSLRVIGLDGTLQGRFVHASVDLEECQGVGAVTVDGGTLAVRRCDQRRFEMTATDATVRVEGFRGAMQVEQFGGSLEGSGISGKVTVKGSAGDVDLTDVTQSVVTVNLENGARARLVQVGRSVSVTATDSELAVNGGGSVAVTAERSDVRLSSIERLNRFFAAESDVQLDLEGLRGGVSLQIHRDSRAAVELSTPCQVRLTGRAAVGSSGVEVSGCELAMGVARRRAPARGVSGEPPVMLTLTTDESSDVEIRGQP